MKFFGNAEGLCKAYVEQEREKVWLEKERIEKERKEAEAKRLEEERAAKGVVEVYKKKEVIEKPPRKVLMSNGEYALVPHIDFEPKGPIGKKAQLEIDKIKMSREQKLEQEFLEDVAKKQKEDRVKAKAKKDFEKKKIEHGVADWNQKE